ncbi:hypothetical protein [Bradyrhizobium sp. sBnM-33]|uniref:hypothetical protein n=1 Tax=Bradyrhizobium sp. sBnM-33 TaxID=2831780 RepID=UPI001BCC8783|nr:hypothetical protein [Bradyrhizobium sp. sBnM-33]WOH47619.1 hypothetical protein RX328_25995 [Bradyrhizobium sp. sBnM-33]
MTAIRASISGPSRSGNQQPLEPRHSAGAHAGARKRRPHFRPINVAVNIPLTDWVDHRPVLCLDTVLKRGAVAVSLTPVTASCRRDIAALAAGGADET